MSKEDSSELEGIEQDDPPLLSPNQNVNVPDGMVSIRFACFTEEKACCAGCCNSKDKLYLHMHQIVLPEDTTVDQFLTIASRKVGAEQKYTICRVNGDFRLRMNDPIGPTIKSYEYIESPILGLGAPAEKCCCLLI